MRIISLILILIVNGLGTLSAQPIQFDKAIDYDSRKEGGIAFVDVRDTFYLFSRGFDVSDPLVLRKDVLSRLSSDGDIIDQQIYFENDPFSYSVFVDNAHLSERGNAIYTIGRKRDTVSQYQGFDLFIMKLDLNGDTIWTKLHQRPDTSEILSDCIMLPGDSMVCAGFTVNNLTENDVNYDIWAVMLDSAGQIIHETSFAGKQYATVASMVPAIDGNGFLICGFDANVEAELFTRNWRIDTNFNIQLEKKLSLASSNTIFRQSSENYVVVEELTYNRQNDFHYPDTITMFDSNWEKIWGVTIPDSGDNQYWVYMTELDDGSMLFGGWGYTYGLTSEFANMLKLSSQGEILWQRRYFADENFRDARLNGLHVGSNNNWIYGWGTTLKDPSGSDAWFVRFDSMGCLTPGCDSIDTGVPLPLTMDEIPIYPNPVSTTFYTDLRSVSNTDIVTIELIDASGKMVLRQQKQAGSIHQLNVEELATGHYSVILYEEGLPFASEKIIKK